MRFLVDVCVGQAIRDWLARKGYDAQLVSESDPKMSDLDILTWAYQEKRVLITLDKDFGKLAFQVGVPHAGVVRLPNVSRQKRLELLEIVLTRYLTALQKQAVITVKPGKIRITPRGIG
ncbi:DUF5615 family PIN-like protein [bacterium]|nr:DUF5615 family PIN-like protein [bacterium]